MALNIRDMVYIVLGCFQSLWLLWRLRPRTVFTRGGFVSVPVGLAAAMLRVSYTTHDSDAIPSLANKLIARWATAHAVALPKETYTSYPQDKTITVGVPVAAEYSRVTAAKQQVYRKTIGLDKAKEIVFVTGGGLGAQIINEAMVSSAKELLAQRKQLYIVHLTGHAHAEVVGAAYDTAIKDSSQRTRVVVKDFVDNLYAYSGAADVVVMRAGATNIAEMAAQAKPCVIVPNPKLTGGHQIKNAAAFAQAAAAVVVDEGVLRRDHMVLAHEISNVLDDPQRARALGAALHEFAHHDAAARLTDLILMLATKGEL